MDWLEREILENTLGQWLAAAAIALAVAGFLLGLQWAVLRRLTGRAAAMPTRWSEVLAGGVRRTKALFLVALGLLAGAFTLDLPDHVRLLIGRAAKVILWIQAGLWVSAAIRGWAEDYRRRRLADEPSAVTSILAVALLAQIFLWGLVVLLVLANAGVQVAPLIAGLGVGGIAVALAVQSILSDLFASLSIVIDKPFVVGDFLIVGDLMGKVEHVGLKTTRLRSLSGEQLVLSNADLLGSRIRNFGRMFERRVAFTIGVVYSTSREQLVSIPKMVREVIEPIASTRFDRSHFKQFGESSLEIETVYFVGSPDFNLYMDIQQRINLELLERFESAGIDFAFPTRTLHVEGLPSDPRPD